MQRDYRSVLTNFKSDDATTHTESSNFCLFSCSCQDMTKLALLLLTTIRSLALIGGVWNSTLMIKPRSKFLKTLIPILFSNHTSAFITHVQRNCVMPYKPYYYVIIFFELTKKFFEKFKFDTINGSSHPELYVTFFTYNDEFSLCVEMRQNGLRSSYC